MAVQLAAKMGFRVVAIARGRDREPSARKLGALHYIDGQAQDVASELKEQAIRKHLIKFPCLMAGGQQKTSPHSCDWNIEFRSHTLPLFHRKGPDREAPHF